MYTTYGYDGTDSLGLLAGLGIGLLILFIFLSIIVIVLYVFQAIALSDLAKKNGYERPWLAWIPIANNLLLGYLGFELYAPKERKSKTLTWIMVAASLTGSITSGDLQTVGLAVASIFSIQALWNIFKFIKPESRKAYTALSAIFGIGGIILFFNRKNYIPANGAPKAPEAKEEKKEAKGKFCPSCGAEIKGNSNFCPKCGSKL